MLPRARGLVVATLLVSGPSASAQVGTVFNRTGSGARAAGMANAFIAISDDGSAASWNPAGLGQLRKPELSLVSTSISQALAGEGFRALDGRSTFTPIHTSYNNTYVDFASLAVPVNLWKKPVTFQAAWRNLYTLDYREVASLTREPLSADGPPPARIDANSDIVGGVNLFSIGAAAKLTPRLALGGSFNLWRGDWREDDAASQTLLNSAEPASFAFTKQTNRIRGESFSMGLLLTYPRWSVGVLHQSPMRSDLSIAVSAQRSGEPATATQTAEGTLRFPRAFGVGGAWRPAPRWTVALDFTWDQWRGTVIETPQTGRISIFDGLPEDRTATRNTLSVNAGAEHLFQGEGFFVPLRFGAAWEPQGARDPYTRDPVNYVMLAAGTGYNTNSLKFDAALQYRWTHYRTGGSFGIDSPPPLMPTSVGERGNQELRLKLSLILRIVDTDKLRRVVHKVLGGG